MILIHFSRRVAPRRLIVTEEVALVLTPTRAPAVGCYFIVPLG